MDIIKSLNLLKKEYFENFLLKKSEKTELTLEKLDKINELFLKIKNKYTIRDQRNVLKDLACLYFLEVYENRDIITIEELEQSYFKEHLKTIEIFRKSLEELGIIKCNYLEVFQEELSVETVFNRIKSVEFLTFDKEKIKLFI